MTNTIDDIGYVHEDVCAGQAAVREICNAVNGGQCVDVAKGITDELRRTHRTLQQDFWRAVLIAARTYGETPYVDLRNEAAVNACKQIGELNVQLPRY